jgi:hypothetical protein
MPDLNDPELRRAVRFLGDLLYFGSPVRELPAKDVLTKAAKAGFSDSTIRRAQEVLKVKSYKQRGIADGPWIWRLPLTFRPVGRRPKSQSSSMTPEARASIEAAIRRITPRPNPQDESKGE